MLKPIRPLPGELFPTARREPGRSTGGAPYTGPYVLLYARDDSGRRGVETATQALLLRLGLPLELKGSVYLNHAMALLLAGRVGLESIGLLYQIIGRRYGQSAGAVEQAIRYAVKLCRTRMPPGAGGGLRGNRAFLEWMLEKLRDPLWQAPGRSDGPPRRLN